MAAAGPAQDMQLRFMRALTLFPIQARINELNSIFGESTIKELQLIYPTLIENIFGVSNNTAGWNIKNITNIESYASFESIQQFLKPDGPLFEVAYKLLSDIYLKYHYRLEFLPQHFRQLIQSGNVPPFYLEKLNVDPVTRAPLSLLLNSFELYFMHFAFHLVSPWHMRPDSPNKSNETVYLHLCAHYLTYFLPIGHSIVLPDVPLHYSAPRSPLPPTQPIRVSKLIKSSAQKTHLNASVKSAPSQEVWRSETILHIIIYFWLYIPEEAKILDRSQAWQDSRASGDHLRVVRNLIKHMHYFANNLVNDGRVMDEMRRSIRTVLQAPIYNFLRYNIHHWPLDSSFLLMLETYLSYIQPWRYQRYIATTQAGQSTNVDNSWMPYLNENLEAYTAVVSELISRFARMDLSSPRHAHMIYRLVKVISEPELPLLLQQADIAAQYRGDQDHVGLFTSATEEKVQELLRVLTSSINVVNNMDKEAKEKKSSGFMQSVREWFLLTSSDEYLIQDRQNTLAYLQFSIKGLCAMFNLNPPENEPVEPDIVEQSLLDDPLQAQKRSWTFKYSGNPDLKPFQSNEVESLAKFWLRMSDAINEEYEHQIEELWNRQDLTGRVSRLFLAPPCQYFYFQKTGPGTPAPRRAGFLPPRVCLRPLASHRTLFLIASFFLVPYVFGYSPILWFLFCLFTFCIVVSYELFVAPWFRKDEPSSSTGPFVPLDVSYQE